MAELKIEIPDELEKEMQELPENWPEVLLETIKLKVLRKKVESKEEKELTKWAVELGRKAKKGRFKRLLAELSPKKREELLNSISPEKKAKLLE